MSQVGTSTLDSQKALILYVTAVVGNCATPVLIQASKGSHLTFGYSAVSVSLYSEALKLILSAILLAIEARSRGLDVVAKFSWPDFAGASLPACCYLGVDLLTFVAIDHLGPVHYSILKQLKIISTGLMYRVVLGVQLTWRKWLAIGCLLLGAVCASAGHESGGAVVLAGTWAGYAAVLGTVVLSPAAGIAFERVLKCTSNSMHCQNCWLYFWGVAMAAGVVLFESVSADEPVARVLLQGHNAFSIALVAAHAVGGLLIAAVLRYLDNIWKNFVAVGVMMLTALLAATLMSLPIPPSTLLGLALTAVALNLYLITPPKDPPDAGQPCRPAPLPSGRLTSQVALLAAARKLQPPDGYVSVAHSHRIPPPRRGGGRSSEELVEQQWPCGDRQET